MTRADIEIVEQWLIATIDKRGLIAMLREWRNEAKSALEANAFADVIDAILSGDFDG